jgi:serine/threonine-protein kinase
VDFEKFGSYRVYECLGAGGMATVHRATIELEDGRIQDIALKRMLPQFATDKRFVEDFVREAKLAVHLQHPNIVRILELGRQGRTYFIAMELVRGKPLMALMRRAHQLRKRAPIGVVLAVMRELCDALEHAHEGTDEYGEPMPIVHRDLTPSNLLVTDDGHLKVIDFGVAKALAGAHQTSSGLAKGKLGYMSLEALGGTKLDVRADIFSAGVVMWELITGRRLFTGANEYEIIIQIQNGAVKAPSSINPECPSEVDEIVQRAVARNCDARWPSAAAMRSELDDVQRYYRDANAAAVATWKRSLRGPSIEADVEATAMLTDDDLYEVEDLAEGSQRSEPPELDGLPLPESRSSAGKFIDSDTVVSAQTTFDRKR